MLLHSHSQTFYPPQFQPGMSMSPSYGSQNHMVYEQRPVPLEIQQMQLQHQIQMDIQQRQHRQMLLQQQQQPGFMHATPSFEEQLLMARAQFDFEAQARAQAELEAQALALHPVHLSQHPFMNGMYDGGVHPVQPMLADVMQVQPTFQSETMVQTLSASSEQSLEASNDEQDVLGYSMENFYRSTNASARQRTQQACEKCRDRKTKCSGTRPTCQRCSDRGLSCVWAPETRTRGLSRQFRFSRSSGEATSDRSLPGSPLLKSAPATQTVFSTFAGRDSREKRGSWHGCQDNPIVRGQQALSMIGGPIESLPGATDGWEEISEARLASPEIVQSTHTRTRAMTVSVAHMARSRDLHKPLEIGPFYVDTNFSPTVASNQSSPPVSGESLPRTDSECSEPPIFTLDDTLSTHIGELHAPQPSYDPTSQLSDEMLRLLHFPDPQASSKAASVIEANENENENDMATPSTTTDFMSQFLTDDIFDDSSITN